MNARPVAAGQVVGGRYRLRDRFGGTGTVWLAFDCEFEVDRLLRQFRLPSTSPEATPEQLVGDARRWACDAAKLDEHPNILTVYDLVESDDQWGGPWIVMGYPRSACSLEEKIRDDGPLPPHEVARIGIDVVKALAFTYARGVVHGDVTPANILVAPGVLTPDSRYLLANFGITLSQSAVWTRPGFPPGSPHYMSPELWDSKPATVAADLFSLGMALWHAVEGRPPFFGDVATLEHAIRDDDPPPARRAGNLEPVLSLLMAKDPGGRQPSDLGIAGIVDLLEQVQPPAPSSSQAESSKEVSEKARNAARDVADRRITVIVERARVNVRNRSGGDPKKIINELVLAVRGSFWLVDDDVRLLLYTALRHLPVEPAPKTPDSEAELLGNPEETDGRSRWRNISGQLLGVIGKWLSEDRGSERGDAESMAKKAAEGAVHTEIGKLGKGVAPGGGDAGKEILEIRDEARRIVRGIPTTIEALGSPKSSAVVGVLIDGLKAVASLTGRDDAEEEIVRLRRTVGKILRDE
jgi:serine/threonine protein kinase